MRCAASPSSRTAASEAPLIVRSFVTKRLETVRCYAVDCREAMNGASLRIEFDDPSTSPIEVRLAKADVERLVERGLTKAPRAYERWTDAEDAHLSMRFRSGLSVNALAHLLEREPGAIRSRLRRHGLRKPRE